MESKTQEGKTNAHSHTHIEMSNHTRSISTKRCLPTSKERWIQEDESGRGAVWEVVDWFFIAPCACGKCNMEVCHRREKSHENWIQQKSAAIIKSADIPNPPENTRIGSLLDPRSLSQPSQNRKWKTCPFTRTHKKPERDNARPQWTVSCVSHNLD